MMCDREDLNYATDLAEKDSERKLMQHGATKARRRLRGMLQWGFAQALQRTLNLGQVTCAQSWLPGLIERDLFKMLRFGSRMERVLQRSNARAFRATWALGTNCTTPESTSRARRSASSIHKFSISVGDSASRLSNNSCASLARSAGGRLKTCSSSDFISMAASLPVMVPGPLSRATP